MDDFNQQESIMAFLLSRRSARAADLVAPGPTAGELRKILTAATRVPDHRKLSPWRFAIIDDRAAFAALVANSYAAEHETTASGGSAFQKFAERAPLMIAAISLPQEGHTPLFEQQLSMGAAIENLLLAAGALGYGSSWVTGLPATLKGVPAGLGHPGGEIAGFLFIGTRSKPLTERPRPTLADIAHRWPDRKAI